MNTRVVMIGLAVGALAAATVSLSAQHFYNTGHRMSYEESSAIKCDMLGGHITGRDEKGHYHCSAPGMASVELDHVIPLCLGGPNDRSNLQLQPWPEAKRKDDDEIRLCEAVSRGLMTREQAVQELAAKWPRHSGQGR